MSTYSKRTLGMGFIVLGVLLVIASFILKSKIEDGEGQIASGKESVQRGQGFFSLNPYTKKAGDQIFSGANKKIAEGEDEIAYYTKTSAILAVCWDYFVCCRWWLYIF